MVPVLAICMANYEYTFFVFLSLVINLLDAMPVTTSYMTICV